MSLKCLLTAYCALLIACPDLLLHLRSNDVSIRLNCPSWTGALANICVIYFSNGAIGIYSPIITTLCLLYSPTYLRTNDNLCVYLMHVLVFGGWRTLLVLHAVA